MKGETHGQTDTLLCTQLKEAIPFASSVNKTISRIYGSGQTFQPAVISKIRNAFKALDPPSFVNVSEMQFETFP